MKSSEKQPGAGVDRKAQRDADSNVHLVGGAIEARVARAKIPPLDAPAVLAPFRRPEDGPAFDAFIARRPLHLEIGFGRPHHLCDLAAAKPQAQVLGFEIRRRWVAQAAKRAAREGLTNVVAIEGDARAYLERLVPDGGVDACYVLFPDPWWKKKHHKRRVFHPAFVALLHRRMAPGGMLVVKTDVAAYADVIDEQLHDHGGFRLAGTGDSDPVMAALPRSHREKKCRELGIPYTALRFTRTP